MAHLFCRTSVSRRLSSDSANDILAMSVPWSAPEVVAEKTSGTVASEVWSLGATLYSLLAGRSPFEIADSSKNSRDQLKARIVKANYTPIGRADVPENVERVLLKAMAKNPSERYQSMLEFALELNELQGDLGLRTTPLELTSNSAWESSSPTVLPHEAEDSFGHQSQVAVDSKRRSRQPSAPAVLRESEGAPVQPKIRSSRKKVSPLVWIVGGAVILGFAIAMGALAAAGVL